MGKLEKAQIESFLYEFKTKLNSFDVIFVNRDKNRNALLQLEITALQRLEYLQSLKLENYFKGPIENAFDPDCFPNWEFGMNIKGLEVYIKISLGKPNKSVICISFHLAEYKIEYPFKLMSES